MTSEPKWAPAPWEFITSGTAGANGDLNIYVEDATGRKIAAVWGKRGEREATAMLIDSAPELYEALAECMKEYGGTRISGRIGAMADAALKKARGET